MGGVVALPLNRPRGNGLAPLAGAAAAAEGAASEAVEDRCCLFWVILEVLLFWPPPCDTVELRFFELGPGAGLSSSPPELRRPRPPRLPRKLLEVAARRSEVAARDSPLRRLEISLHQLQKPNGPTLANAVGKTTTAKAAAKKVTAKSTVANFTKIDMTQKNKKKEAPNVVTAEPMTAVVMIVSEYSTASSRRLAGSPVEEITW
mmetsp:Transcript_86110/g.223800  ORF Transcript_86110/g.223800 Transcript_86110/m.223800 type:complete len:204 (-) Transcript_86110:817-1428(-)